MSKQQVKKEKVAATSGDILEAQVAKVRSLFPECVAEGKIDFEKLRATLGGATESGPGRFAEKLKKRKDVRLFVKLPNWFKVATPVGQYNPDWALVMEQVEDAKTLLYLVRETKSTTVADELRGTENQKIHCGERHFTGALNVNFKVVTNADDLP